MSRKLALPAGLRRAEAPLVFGVFVVLRSLDLIADLDWWVYALIIGVAAVLPTISEFIWPRDRRGAAMWLRILVLSVCITAVMYSTGWGPMLAVGYMFGLADNLDDVGARACRPVQVWAVVCMFFGELAIQVGIAPSFVPTPEIHGLAVLAALGVVVTVRVVEQTVRAKEVAEVDVRQSEQRFRELVANASDIILVFDEGGAVSYMSPAFERVLGYRPENDRLQIGADLLHPEDLERAEEFFAGVLAEPGGVGWIEIRLRDAHGDWHWFEVGVANLVDEASVRGMVANMHDVTERRLFEEQLSYQAYHDALTRLPNRASFLERLRNALTRAVENGSGVAVLFLDVDRFKLVNDSLGHEVGDRLLVEVADRLKQCLRPGDLVARFGGDEFTILLDDADGPGDAIRVAERVTHSLRQPFVVGGRELVVTGSLGISMSDGQDEATELLREADLAMYLAKDKGRARWELFDERSAPPVVERLELEAELWRAVEHDELVVHYQPEVSLEAGKVVAFEALVRWQHPQRGMLLPTTFVPFAEDSNLIVAIDRFVLQQACVQAREWQDLRPKGRRLRVSVNLSPRFIRRLEAIDDVLDAMRAAGLDPECLQLEITERSALSDEHRTLETLEALRALGIRVAIDDFGTGYSSLAYLKRFPVDVLKLDRSFVEGMDEAASDLAIVEAVITMGHALGMRIAAEGVERPEQAASLRSLGCDTAQGFHFAAALPGEDATELVQRDLPVIFDEGRVVPLPVRTSGKRR